MAIIYKSTDADAPVMTGADKTSLIRTLRACLVDGYGTKRGAGWLMPFVNADGTKAAFKNAGTGFYLLVDDSAPGVNATCSAFESMSDIDTGINAIGPSFSRQGRVSLNSNAIPWIIVANDKFVLFVIYINHSSYPSTVNTMCSVIFFGDFISNRNGDSFCCLVDANNNSASSLFGLYNLSYYIARPYSGVAGSVRVKLLQPFANGFGFSNEEYSNNANLVVSKVMVIEDNIIRGFLDGCLAPLQKTPFLNDRTVSIDGKDYEVVTWAGSNYYVLQLLCEVTE